MADATRVRARSVRLAVGRARARRVVGGELAAGGGLRVRRVRDGGEAALDVFSDEKKKNQTATRVRCAVSLKRENATAVPFEGDAARATSYDSRGRGHVSDRHPNRGLDEDGSRPARQPFCGRFGNRRARRARRPSRRRRGSEPRAAERRRCIFAARAATEARGTARATEHPPRAMPLRGTRFRACRRPADGKDLSHARPSPRGAHDARLGALSGWRRAGRVAVGRARAVTRKHASFGDGGARRTFGTSRASRDPAKLPSPIAAGASRRALPRGFSSRSSSGSHCPGNAPSAPGVGWGIARLDADAGDARTRGEVRMRSDVGVARER